MDINFNHLCVRLVSKSEEPRYRELMRQHHYLGDLAKIGQTLWYVAVLGDEWVALLGFTAAAWKCGARDHWIGWDFRHQYGRLGLIANNSRFLILPDWHHPNLGSKVLSLCHKRIVADWRIRFGQPLLLLETFVDPTRFHGTVYRAANWVCLGQTKGFRRTREGYGVGDGTPKLVFVRELCGDARARLASPILNPEHDTGTAKTMLTAAQMRVLPDYFRDIPDPRTTKGRRHRLHVVLAIVAAATLCGMRGYKDISGWAQALNQTARERFLCRRENGISLVPSRTIIRDVLIRVDPGALDDALRKWNDTYGEQDPSLLIDRKDMCSPLPAGRHGYLPRHHRT